jgi:hypothetical protein
MTMKNTMLKKANWNADEYRYEIPITVDEIVQFAPERELDASVQYRRTAFWDRYTKNWIVDIIDAEGHQVVGAEFFANKRTFAY